MRTWQETYELAQQLSGDTSASILTMLKSDLNLGAKKLNTSMGRYFTRQSKSTNLVAGQQYYQTPPDCLKVTGIDFLLSTDRRLLQDRYDQSTNGDSLTSTLVHQIT